MPPVPPGKSLRRRTALAAVAAVGAQMATSKSRASAATGASAEDERFMTQAIEEARKADFPFGCVITANGAVIARGGNIGRQHHDPTAHGEMTAIRNCVSADKTSELKGATLYTTGEPCPMCMGAIVWSGISRVVYAVSIDELAAHMNQIMVSSEQIARASFHPVEIVGGVGLQEARPLFARFKKQAAPG
ncbi:nucleoside deaminase [Acetobacter sacchari]|uniref:Nucleoside deaminase n=1 Tax=Acetobacter sacchari TaxID=2661687 RepID=A0ABS3LXP6_9PROT|nr:nucleoside deaminase [Acetobacter sacchari]MBO1360692.1 nucleoside deaminase [Acetobacter sacchari]